MIKEKKKTQKQITIKNILLGEQSVHEGINTMKFDESINHGLSINHQMRNKVS
jgi:hypothetical protein